MDEPPRFLHRRSELGYTHVAALGLRDAGEALTSEQLGELAQRAQERALERQRGDWEASRAVLTREIAWLFSQRFRKDVGSQIRALERQVARLDDKIGRRR